jgi:hypothetical protein
MVVPLTGASRCTFQSMIPHVKVTMAMDKENVTTHSRLADKKSKPPTFK